MVHPVEKGAGRQRSTPGLHSPSKGAATTPFSILTMVSSLASSELAIELLGHLTLNQWATSHTTVIAESVAKQAGELAGQPRAHT